MFKSKEIKKKYQERFRRYITAMNGGTPDRIPIRFLYQEVAARYAGLTNQQVACDYQRICVENGRGNVRSHAKCDLSNYGLAKSAS